MAHKERLNPPPTIVSEFNSPVWKSWFSKVYDTISFNSYLSGSTTATAITADKSNVIIVTSNVTITLPDADHNADKHYYIKRVTAAGAVTVASSDNIDGSASVSLAANYDSIHVFCDGTTWHIIGRE